MFSYHDVVVVVNGTRYKIRDSYAYELTCTRVAGWRLWHHWEGHDQLIGGEFDAGTFRIEVGDVVIVDTEQQSAE